MIGRWRWSQNGKENKIHWLAWEKLTLPKKKGRLGFRDLHLFNIAMLARQAWRLLIKPDTLCGQVLKAKYFPEGNVLQAILKDEISYTWRSILKGVELLKDGIIWRVGNGESIKIWEDPWIPQGVTRRPITRRDGMLLRKVSELMDPATGLWDELLVLDNFLEYNAHTILKLRVNQDVEDQPAWHYDKKGMFSVKSAYKLAVQQREEENGRNATGADVGSGEQASFKWDKIWGMEVPNKVRMFTWRLVHNSLLVRRNLARRGVKEETICPMCSRLDEDCGYLFFKCKKVKECWRMLNMEEYRLKLVDCQSGKEMM